MAKPLTADPGLTAAELHEQDRNVRIWQLHVAGHSSREIGAIVKVSHTTVWKVLQESRGDTPLWTVDQVRMVEDERLRRLLLALLEGVEAGEVPAIEAARKISESRRKLYGADGPLTVNVNHGDLSAIDAAYQDLVAEMNEANSRREAKLRDRRSV